MATVCNVEILAVGRDGAAVQGVCARRDTAVASARPQRVVVVRATVEKRWPSVRVVAQPVFGLRVRCNAASGDGQNKKNYDVNEVVEKVVSDEENQLPEEEKEPPEPLPEGEPSPFSPAIDTDNMAFQGEGVSKDSMIEPPRGMQEGAASASIGEGLGASEESALAADIGGSPKSGPGGHGRDWRVQSSKGGRSAARVKKATDTEAQPEHQKQMFRPSEAACDDGSSFLAEEGILETDGGKSVDDYKRRAHIFSESADFFIALKNR